jgi:hypothetical protein
MTSAAYSVSFPYAALDGERLSARVARQSTAAGLSVVSQPGFEELSKVGHPVGSRSLWAP